VVDENVYKIFVGNLQVIYSRITFTFSPTFFMTIPSMNVTNITVLPAQSRDCICYVSRRILAHPPFLTAETQ